MKPSLSIHTFTSNIGSLVSWCLLGLSSSITMPSWTSLATSFKILPSLKSGFSSSPLEASSFSSNKIFLLSLSYYQPSGRTLASWLESSTYRSYIWRFIPALLTLALYKWSHLSINGLETAPVSSRPILPPAIC